MKYYSNTEFFNKFENKPHVKNRFIPLDGKVDSRWKYYVVSDKSAKYYRSQSRKPLPDNLAGFTMVQGTNSILAVFGFNKEEDAFQWMLSN